MCSLANKSNGYHLLGSENRQNAKLDDIISTFVIKSELSREKYETISKLSCFLYNKYYKEINM